MWHLRDREKKRGWQGRPLEASERPCGPREGPLCFPAASSHRLASKGPRASAAPTWAGFCPQTGMQGGTDSSASRPQTSIPASLGFAAPSLLRVSDQQPVPCLRAASSGWGQPTVRALNVCPRGRSSRRPWPRRAVSSGSPRDRPAGSSSLIISKTSPFSRPVPVRDVMAGFQTWQPPRLQDHTRVTSPRPVVGGTVVAESH